MTTMAQAQLHINVIPAKTTTDSGILWIFRSSSDRANYGSSIRSSQNYHARDSWQIESQGQSTNFYAADKPTNQFFSLSPLFSSTNNPKDIESVQLRIPGGGYKTPSFLPASPTRRQSTLAQHARGLSDVFL